MTVEVTTQTVSNVKFDSTGSRAFRAAHDLEGENIKVTFPCGESDSFSLETIKAVAKAIDFDELDLDEGEGVLRAVSLTFKFESAEGTDYYAQVNERGAGTYVVISRGSVDDGENAQFLLSTLNELASALGD